MNKGTLKLFLKGTTTHRFPKIVTLAVTSSLLVTMITIDASASSTTPTSRLVHHANQSSVELTLQSKEGLSHLATFASVWHPVTKTPPPAPSPSGSPATATTNSPSSPVTTTTSPTTTTSSNTVTTSPTTPSPTTTTTSPPAPPTTTTAPSPTPGFPVGTSDNSEPSGDGPPSAGALTGYSETYATDFSGTTLPSVWDAYEGQPGGDPGGQFDTGHVVVSGGMLQIKTFQDPGFNNGWVTGGLCLCGIKGQTYGAYFVRSRVTGGGSTAVELLWPDGNSWPPEIDFNEDGGGTSSTTATVHFGASNSQIGRSLNIDMTQWHTWGVIWTPTSITYTVDGTLWGSVTTANAIPTVPMHISIQSQTFCASGWACPSAPSSLDVDWVAEYASN